MLPAIVSMIILVQNKFGKIDTFSPIQFWMKLIRLDIELQSPLSWLEIKKINKPISNSFKINRTRFSHLNSLARISQLVLIIIEGYLWVGSRMFHRTTICGADNYTGKNFVPSIKTISPVVKAVKLMAWRRAKSPLKITTWSGGQRSASQIS